MKKIILAVAVCIAVAAPAFAAEYGGVSVYGGVSNGYLEQNVNYDAWMPASGITTSANLNQTVGAIGNADAFAANWVDHSTAPGVAVLNTGIYGETSAFIGAAGINSNNSMTTFTPNAVVMTNGNVDLSVVGIGAATGSSGSTVIITN